MAVKRGLLIGISEYKGLDAEYQLKGAANDPELWTEVLTSPSYGFGFQPAEMTVLQDAEASHDAILASFAELVAQVEPDDIVFVLFSGHGSQLKSANPLEPDGRDETIIPADATGLRGLDNRKDITDAELNEVLWSLSEKTPRVTMVFDCCHSGSITRDAVEARLRGIAEDPRDRTQAEIDRATQVANLNLGARPTVLSACRDDEESFEYHPGGGEPWHGALTWFLTRALKSAHSEATYRDVFEAAATDVTSVFPNSHPTIWGAIDRELFGIVDRRPVRYLPVTDRNGDDVTIGAGAAQLVDVGSRWTAYPPGTLEPAPNRALALLVVTSTDATSATATAADGAALPAGVIAGTRVFNSSLPLEAGDVKLPVALAANAGALAGLIEASPVLRRVEPDDPAAYARVFTIGPRAAAPPGDPVPELHEVAEPTVAVVGPDGHLLIPPSRTALAETPRLVCADLETFARYKRVLELDNPGTAIAGAVEMELLRDANGGNSVANANWVVATPDDKGNIVYQDGDLIGVRLTSRSDTPHYVALVDLGLTYKVWVFSEPEVNGSSALAPRYTFNHVSQGNDEGYALTMDGFPWVPTGTNADRGIETFKLFVTTGAADFSFLAQEGVGPEFRGIDDDWTTVTRRFIVERP